MAQIEIEVDNHLIEAEVKWKCTGKSGIGSYEFWGSNYNDEGEDEYEIESITITSAFDPEGNEIPLSEITKEQKDLWEDWITAKAEPEIAA